MNGEVDSLVNFPIDTSLKTIAHSAMSKAASAMTGSQLKEVHTTHATRCS